MFCWRTSRFCFGGKFGYGASFTRPPSTTSLFIHNTVTRIYNTFNTQTTFDLQLPLNTVDIANPFTAATDADHQTMSQELNDSSTFEKQLASETIPMLLTTPVSATESEGVDMDGSDTSVGVQHKKPKEGEETSEVKGWRWVWQWCTI